ncbi:hypothetical protein RRG08_005970 [Elysia crispata]|uniref:Uncharacterized protein n=1 Tax=Elysia crispata TaxID=231223 RepID=A0AAE0YPR3_9GAST|nr:hypothetical protein RRG08_005970 [Elysia crispata]
MPESLFMCWAEVLIQDYLNARESGSMLKDRVSAYAFEHLQRRGTLSDILHGISSITRSILIETINNRSLDYDTTRFGRTYASTRAKYGDIVLIRSRLGQNDKEGVFLITLKEFRRGDETHALFSTIKAAMRDVQIDNDWCISEPTSAETQSRPP